MVRNGTETPFESWIGQPVIVRLALKHTVVSLRGTVLKDRAETVLMRDEHGLQLEISKNTVLAIEEVRAHSAE